MTEPPPPDPELAAALSPSDAPTAPAGRGSVRQSGSPVRR